MPSEYGGHEWILGAAAAAYYGFAVAMPDQPGMGGDSQAYHPFCHGKSLAYSTLDALPALERLVGDPGDLAASPLGPGLEPYPDNWRADVRAPRTLPHYPMVLHRGGYPDGS